MELEIVKLPFALFHRANVDRPWYQSPAFETSEDLVHIIWVVVTVGNLAPNGCPIGSSYLVSSGKGPM